MKEVKQTIIDTDRGNCLSACLASILELDIEEVPNFVWHFKNEFDDAVQLWLAARGYAWLRIRMPKEIKTGDDIRFHALPRVLCLATGKSPRGDYYHSVVGEIVDGYNFRLVHDPHPDGTGLDGPPVCVEFLIPRDPNAHVYKHGAGSVTEAR